MQEFANTSPRKPAGTRIKTNNEDRLRRLRCVAKLSASRDNPIVQPFTIVRKTPRISSGHVDCTQLIYGRLADLAISFGKISETCDRKSLAVIYV